MKIEILTIFPEIFSGFLSSSLIQKSIERGLATIHLSNIRDFAAPPHFAVDDSPYGGGAGMVMKPEPLAQAILAAKSRLPSPRVILLTPTGTRLTQAKASEISTQENLILICGRYEGIDQRVIDLFVDEQISIGDYILMGGEIPAMVLIETTLRLVPSVLGNSESSKHESFSAGMLEAPHYTRPPEFMGKKVPEVLLSGNHQHIQQWRSEAARCLTQEKRPDLMEQTK